MTAEGTRRAAVLGSPIGHSLSPVLHRAAYAALGLVGWSYDAHEVAETQLASFLDGLDGSWAGLSLTMPLKAAVLPLLDDRTELVDVVGAANTVVLTAGGRRGDNTDVPGIAAALEARGFLGVEIVSVLGGGATARSAVAATAQVASHAHVFARSAAREGALAATADAVGVPLTVRPWTEAREALTAPLVVNTAPAGAADHLAARVPPQPGTLLEVVYDPWPTPLAAAWAEQGGAVVDGLDVLVHQARLQVALMTGARTDVPGFAELLRGAGERALARR